MKYIYAPGCALMAYKPQLAERLRTLVINQYGDMPTLLTCCFNKPQLDPNTYVITPCATCAENYAQQYHSIFFLEELSQSTTFPFPNYGGAKMSIQDTCSARSHPQYLSAIRQLLERMNIHLEEPQRTAAHAKCCGQTFYGKIEIPKVEEQMRIRANEMPCNDVVVYCASCIMSMLVGGKQPRYLLDLLFDEPTDTFTSGVEKWNQTLKQYRDTH